VSQNEPTVYELVGGNETFERLVNAFYERVEADAVLRAVFPEDLEPGKHWQKLFLIQLFGGPATYSAIRGHPRLRMRHFPFAINAESAQRWLQHMLEAIDEVSIPEPARTTMRAYFLRAAPHMVNVYPNENIVDSPE
jgi:hemoglobin